MKIHSIEDEKKWISWLDKHKGWIDRLSQNYSTNEKKEIVNEYVTKILVDFDKSINQHKLKIHLKLPIVNDKFKRRNTKKYSYDLFDGSNVGEVLVDKVSVGRKKKSSQTI